MRFSAEEVVRAIFTDEDSNDEDFDCGFIRLTQMMEQVMNGSKGSLGCHK